jgi:hypothetical protein
MINVFCYKYLEIRKGGVFLGGKFYKKKFEGIIMVSLSGKNYPLTGREGNQLKEVGRCLNEN